MIFENPRYMHFASYSEIYVFFYSFIYFSITNLLIASFHLQKKESTMNSVKGLHHRFFFPLFFS